MKIPCNAMKRRAVVMVCTSVLNISLKLCCNVTRPFSRQGFDCDCEPLHIPISVGLIASKLNVKQIKENEYHEFKVLHERHTCMSVLKILNQTERSKTLLY